MTKVRKLYINRVPLGVFRKYIELTGVYGLTHAELVEFLIWRNAMIGSPSHPIDDHLAVDQFKQFRILDGNPVKADENRDEVRNLSWIEGEHCDGRHFTLHMFKDKTDDELEDEREIHRAGSGRVRNDL